MAQAKNRSPKSSRKPRLEAKKPTDREHIEWLVDEALKESFPSSDPPAWTLGRERVPDNAEEETADDREG